jgi:hypothetical protein
MTLLLLIPAAILLLWASILLAFARPLLARWREPVFRYPILIIESDDWGAGPLEQAEALRKISTVLHGIRDRTGRPVVMTLGVILEVPDGPRIAAGDCREYHALPLSDPRFDDVRAAMQEGTAAGVFAPQLHGQCHYWPPAVMAAAKTDPAVRAWLTTPEPAATEQLPSHLQSRWVDASVLPSRALNADDVRQALAHEASAYEALFGAKPQVAVATTFVWNDVVEAAWSKAGIEVIITPGRRAAGRNAAGAPDFADKSMLTGERSLSGETYLVRDVYFEPTLGHAPQRLVEGLQARTRQGRACLVETHRFNFLRALDESLSALRTALEAAGDAVPSLRFVTPLELGLAIQHRDPSWIETGMKRRLAAWLTRLDEIPRFGRVARLSGLAWPLNVLGGAT